MFERANVINVGETRKTVRFFYYRIRPERGSSGHEAVQLRNVRLRTVSYVLLDTTTVFLEDLVRQMKIKTLLFFLPKLVIDSKHLAEDRTLHGDNLLEWR